MIRKILSSLLVLLVLLSFSVYGETPGESKVSFGLPFRAPDWEGINETPPNWAGRRSLADSFEAGLQVAIVSKWGVCEAKTGHKFQCEDPERGGNGFEATLLKGAEKCPGGAEQIAVINLAPAAVRLVAPSNDRSPIPKDVEMEARRLVKREVGHVWPISDSPPRVTRVEGLTLVDFGCVTQSPEDEPVAFAGALIVDSRIFPFDTLCTREYLFFAVKNKLHLSCFSFWGRVSVYNLSKGTPAKVYENGELADRD